MQGQKAGVEVPEKGWVCRRWERSHGQDCCGGGNGGAEGAAVGCGKVKAGSDDDGKAGEMANGRRAETTMTRARPGSETTTAGGVKR